MSGSWTEPGTASDPLVGKVIADRYEVGAMIASGGMGAVYRARQNALGRDVAIKFARPDLVDPGAVQRFMTEAHAASLINHPHVVSVFDFGRASEADGELLFLVMELVTGLDLSETLAEAGPLPLSRVPPIVIQTLQALSEAHHHGIVHRDVKPENIILSTTRTGRDHVKVIDFGLARVASENRIHDAAQVSGTPVYMAPEAALGKLPGPLADLYSVGVVLFELLTGKLPFERETASATLLAHVSAPRPDPRSVAPERNISAALAAVCLQAMAIRPEERFADAAAFERALVSAAREQHEPLPLDPPAKTSSSDAPSDPGVGGATHQAPLVGREADLAWARAHLFRAAQGSRWLEICGPSGTGKTRLLHAIGELAADAGAALVPFAVDPPPCDEGCYGSLRRLVVQLSGLPLEALVSSHDVGVIDASARAGLLALSLRATVWRGDPEGARRDAAGALSWAARRACSRGSSGRVVVLLDDLDRLDGASRNAILDQQRTHPVTGLTIVSTSERPTSAESGDRITSRQLAGLSRADALRMLASRNSEAVLARLDDAIEPLYIEQLSLLPPARASEAPSTLKELALWQLQGLSAAQRKLLQAVAVVGMVREDGLDALVARRGQVGGASLQTRPTLMRLAEAGFLTIADDQISVSHPIYARAALAQAPGGVLAELHRAAEEQLGPERALLELRAYHAIRGRADFQAFLAVEESARLRTHQGDAAGAISLLWHAVNAARVQVMRDEGSAAASALGVFGRKLATALINDGRLDEAQGILDEILNAVDPADIARALVLEQLAAIAHLQGRPEESVRHQREALGIAVQCGDGNASERLSAFLCAGGAVEAISSPRRQATVMQPGRRPVLVVEDDRDIRERLQSMIEADARQAFAAANGDEALELLRRIPRPGLILLDLMMPVMTGWELLERLSSTEEFADIPVVVVSAVSKREEPGAIRVIPKWIESNALLTLVEEFCG